MILVDFMQRFPQLQITKQTIKPESWLAAVFHVMATLKEHRVSVVDKQTHQDAAHTL